MVRQFMGFVVGFVMIAISCQRNCGVMVCWSTYTPQRSPPWGPCSRGPPAAGLRARRTHRSGACRGRTGKSWRTLREAID